MEEKGRSLTVRIHRIRGHCPVYKEGQSFRIRDGYVLDTSVSCDVCMHALASIFPYYVALSHGVAPEWLGLAGPKPGRAYVQCLDPCDLTGGGTVTFEIERD